jgi:hypothetical protein
MSGFLTPHEPKYFADGLLPFAQWAKQEPRNRREPQKPLLRCDISVAEVDAVGKLQKLFSGRGRRLHKSFGINTRKVQKLAKKRG